MTVKELLQRWLDREVNYWGTYASRVCPDLAQATQEAGYAIQEDPAGGWHIIDTHYKGDPRWHKVL